MIVNMEMAGRMLTRSRRKDFDTLQESKSRLYHAHFICQRQNSILFRPSIDIIWTANPAGSQDKSPRSGADLNISKWTCSHLRRPICPINLLPVSALFIHGSECIYVPTVTLNNDGNIVF